MSGKDNKENEKIEKAEAEKEKLEKEKLEKEKAEKAEAERLEKEKIEKAEAEKIEKERLEKEKIEDASVPSKKTSVDAVIAKAPEKKEGMVKVKIIKDVNNLFIAGNRYTFKEGSLVTVPDFVGFVLRRDKYAF